MIDFATIRSSTDLVELAGRYVDLKRSGHEYVGLCPFHGEKTPSFYVNGEKGSFYCFGCGAKGDALDFIRMIDGVTLEEALEQLDGNASPRPRPTRAPVRTEPRPGPDAAALWARLALTDPAGEAYLDSRGLLPVHGIPDVLRYNVGGSGDWWLNTRAHEGYRVAFAVRSPGGDVQTISLRHIGPGTPPDEKKTLALYGCSTSGAAICQPHIGELGSGDVEHAGDEVLIVEGGTSWLGAHIETMEDYANGGDRPIWPLGAIGVSMAPGVVTAFSNVIRGRTVLVGLDEDAAGEAQVIPTANAAMAAGAARVCRVRRDFGARRAA